MSPRKLADIECEVVGETAAAWRIHDGKTTDWVPKSQVEIDDSSGENWVVCTMPIWLAREKGFI